MTVYDDGLAPPVASAPLPSKPVFCIICREGLHDDADDEQPSPTMENEGEEPADRGQSNSPSASLGGNDQNQMADDSDDREPAVSEPPGPLAKGPVQPHPTYHPNPHAAENLMLVLANALDRWLLGWCKNVCNKIISKLSRPCGHST